MAREVRRSVLELPVTSDQSLFEIWQCEVGRLARLLGRMNFPVHLLLDRHSREPRTAAHAERVSFHISRDRSEYRGTAGILRDAAGNHDADEFLLVANAAQLLLEPLEEMCVRMAELGADATIVSHRDGTPGGLMLIRCGCLRELSPTGYIDLKEQALPRIAEKNDVRVLRHLRPVGLPLRTRGDYLSALRSYHQSLSNSSSTARWLPSFAIVEEPQTLGPRSAIHDSVVLRGGRVEAGATVVRSIVCPGGVVAAHTILVDGLVSADFPPRSRPFVAG